MASLSDIAAIECSTRLLHVLERLIGKYSENNCFLYEDYISLSDILHMYVRYTCAPIYSDRVDLDRGDILRISARKDNIVLCHGLFHLCHRRQQTRIFWLHQSEFCISWVA